MGEKNDSTCINTEQPCALAISEAWPDDTAPDSTAEPDSSGAVRTAQELSAVGKREQQLGLPSHQGSVVQISSGTRDAPQSNH